MMITVTEALPTMYSQQAMTACLIILDMKVIIIRINSTAYIMHIKVHILLYEFHLS